MKTRASFFFVLIAVALLGSILACNASAPRPTADLAQIVAQTETAIAVSAALTPSTTIQYATPTPPVIPGQASPTPPVQPPTKTPGSACVNRAKFISETIPDATQFSPRSQFMKTWILQNTGSCTWTPDFSLTFVRGEQMGGTSPAPIGQTIPPNGTIQVYLPQTAPDSPGEHQGFWMLSDLSGGMFGLGEDAATPFWVKINVVAGLATTIPATAGPSNLGAPARTITFSNNTAPFYLGDDDDIGFRVQNNALILTAFRQSGDQWRVAELGSFTNFAIEARFRSGSICAGKDTYGLLLRAPSQSDGIIDSGHVIGFNCDGQYRVYRMDNGGYTGIITWAANSAVKVGPNQENVMTVIANDDRFLVYANGSLLTEFYDPAYSAGLWGLMIGSGGSSNFQAAVSQISIWDLP